jgi:hypothetical protein
VILRKLDDRSYLHRSMGFKEHAEDALWDQKDYLLAAAINSLRSVEFLLANANWQRGGGKGEKPKMPDLVKSPRDQLKEKEEAKQFATAQEITNFFNTMNAVNRGGSVGD